MGTAFFLIGKLEKNIKLKKRIKEHTTTEKEGKKVYENIHSTLQLKAKPKNYGKED